MVFWLFEGKCSVDAVLKTVLLQTHSTGVMFTNKIVCCCKQVIFQVQNNLKNEYKFGHVQWLMFVGVNFRSCSNFHVHRCEHFLVIF